MFVAMTETALADLLGKDLSSLDLVALMIDGIHVADHVRVAGGGERPIPERGTSSSRFAQTARHLGICGSPASPPRAMISSLTASRARAT